MDLYRAPALVAIISKTCLKLFKPCLIGFFISLSMTQVFLNVPSFLWLNKAKVISHDSPQRPYQHSSISRFDDSSLNKIYYVGYWLGPTIKWLRIAVFSYNHLIFGPNNIPCFKNDILLMN